MLSHIKIAENKGNKYREAKGATDKEEVVSYLHCLFIHSIGVDLLDKVENNAFRKRCGVQTVYFTFKEEIRTGFTAKNASSFLVIQGISVFTV